MVRAGLTATTVLGTVAAMGAHLSKTALTLVMALASCGGRDGDPGGSDASVGIDALRDDAGPSDGGGPRDGSTADVPVAIDAPATDAPVGIDTGPGTDAGASANIVRWRAHCESTCSDPGERMYCDETGDCYDAWYRADAFARYIDCVEPLVCRASDDTCAAMAIMGSRLTPEGKTFASACETRSSECPGALSPEICNREFASTVLPEILAAYMACLMRPCASVGMCIGAARPRICGG